MEDIPKSDWLIAKQEINFLITINRERKNKFQCIVEGNVICVYSPQKLKENLSKRGYEVKAINGIPIGKS